MYFSPLTAWAPLPSSQSTLRATVSSSAPPSGVTFDEYSLLINGQRIFLSSGEFHPWRLPVSALWLDILQKMKALGFNGVSIYTHWGMIEPRRGELDFEGINDLQLFFDMAMEAGLWVTVRPGPYINAETTGGGIPGWVAGSIPTLRDNSTAYFEAWKPYMTEISKITARNQFDKGGPVILFQVENEYVQNEQTVPYMESLIAIAKENGITVPITFNDANEKDNFARGPGAVELYGFDNYPLGFGCATPSFWPASVSETHYSYHKRVNPEQPNIIFVPYLPVDQAGVFDAWGPNSPGYDKCLVCSFPFSFSLWAQNSKMISYYMAYGGTNWGHIGSPRVYTSYEESRELAQKASELKRQLIFLRGMRDFYKTVQIANSTSKYTDNDDIHVTELRNPDNAAKFFVLRHKDSRSTCTSTFTVEFAGMWQFLPSVGRTMQLHGREAKVVVSDVSMGERKYEPLTTSQMFFSGKVGHKTVLCFYHGGDNLFTFTFPVSHGSSGIPQSFGGSLEIVAEGEVITYIFETVADMAILHWVRSDIIIVCTTAVYTDRLWAPVVQNPNNAPFDYFDGVGDTGNILVWGPDLVRTVKRTADELFIDGDISANTTVELISPPFKRLYWNNEEISFEEKSINHVTSYWWSANILFENPVVELPNLEQLEWWMKDGLPEREKEFDDSRWKIVEGDLNACRHGFCVGHVLYRGHFVASRNMTGISLTLRGGTGFAASVFLDGFFIGTTYGNSSNHQNDIPETTTTFQFPEGLHHSNDQKHLVTVLCDNMGLERSNDSISHDAIKDPRGIVAWDFVGHSAKLIDENMVWKIQGNIPDDKVRKAFNAGGLFAERAGWHLPSWHGSEPEWSIHSPMRNGSYNATVKWFQTTFDLNIPEGYDIPMFLQLPPPLSANGLKEPYRAQIYVNGWQMGKYVSNLGPQFKFPLHEGILNYRGKNTLAIALWDLEETGAKIGSLSIRHGAIYHIGKKPRRRTPSPPS
ncbi:glycoside hydrolase family 35 protein [Atractiella rhizophila]|nr:glycoside hydrolase family 35 protein [Atractiella rhizophila]